MFVLAVCPAVWHSEVREDAAWSLLFCHYRTTRSYLGNEWDLGYPAHGAIALRRCHVTRGDKGLEVTSYYGGN